MNFYVEALQDEHKILESVLDSYRNQLGGAIAKAFEALRSGSASRLMFCGMGSSYYAALSVIAPLNAAGIRATAHNCYELLHYNLDAIDANAVVVAISQSGNTPEVVSLVEASMKRAAATVTMFNNPDCRLKGMADAEMLLEIGPETPISNKTYYAQVAQLNLLAAWLTGGDLDKMLAEIRKAISWHDEYVAAQTQITGDLIDTLKGVTLCDVLGDDAQLGAALQAGLVMREMGGIPVCAHSLSDYNHGWFEIANPDYAMIIMADRLSENDEKMIAHCQKNGGRVLLFTPQRCSMKGLEMPEAPKSLLPLYTIVPAYFIAGLYRERA